jgi:autophagy-related protein 13
LGKSDIRRINITTLNLYFFSHHKLQFNLITTDIDGLRDELKYWRHQIAKVADRTPYPMIIDIFLDTSKMADDMTLMFVNNRGIHRPVNTIGTHGGKIHSVLLESWILQLKYGSPT